MFEDILWLDLETRSRVNLKTHGHYRYVECPDHKVMVASYALNDEPVKSVLTLHDGLPVELRNMLKHKKVQVRAHHAAFDRAQLGKLAPPIERWFCTATQARAMALPGSLEDAPRAVGVKMRKDRRGAELIQLLSIPQADGRFNEDPKLLREFVAYGGSDVEVMRALSKNLPDLSDFDLQVYHASEIVNDRGMPIDLELCTLAMQYAAAEKVEAEAEVVRVTAGVLTKAKGQNLTKWVARNLPDDLRSLVVRVVMSAPPDAVPPRGGDHTDVRPGAGTRHPMPVGAVLKEKFSLAADVREQLLEIGREDPDRIPEQVMAVLEANDAASLSSVAKFRSMQERVSADGRLRGAFVMNGAYQTGRWSSKGAQVHNYPRLCAENPEAVLKLMKRGEPLGNTLEVLKSMLRPAICPGRGKYVVRCDWNAVEARGLPWLAGPEALEYLNAFKDKDRDIYIEQAVLAGLGEARQAGKVVVLSMGYGGAAGALAAMAKGYKVHIDHKDAVVQRWRRANPWAAHKTRGWWAKLKLATLRAHREGGGAFKAEGVSMQYDGYSMQMVLPSGRRLYYPDFKVTEGPMGPNMEALKASWKPKADAEHWPRGRIWHGTLAENATQAAMNDLLRVALVRAVKAGLPVIGHVHDELIGEATGKANAVILGADMRRCMLASPPWAKGLPLAAEVDIAPRFRK